MYGPLEQIPYEVVSETEREPVAGYIISEVPLTLYLDGEELVTIVCTPIKVKYLVLGFLQHERFITGMADVAHLEVCLEDGYADVRLSEEALARRAALPPPPPRVRVLTSGCGGGTTFQDLLDSGQYAKVESGWTVTPGQVFRQMKAVYEHAELYRHSRGVHTSALSDGERLLVLAEDVGRHNTLDKVRGECLYWGVPTTDRMLLSTGRISSEMLLKAAGMGVPITVSRTSPTASSVELGRQLGITVIGYVRGGRMQVYTHGQRIRLDPAAAAAAERNGHAEGERRSRRAKVGADDGED